MKNRRRGPFRRLPRRESFKFGTLLRPPLSPKTGSLSWDAFCGEKRKPRPHFFSSYFCFSFMRRRGGLVLLVAQGSNYVAYPPSPLMNEGMAYSVLWSFGSGKKLGQVQHEFPSCFFLSFLRQIWSMNSYKLFHTFTEEHCRQGIFKNISQGVSQVKYTRHYSVVRIPKHFLKKNFVPRSLWTSRTACSRAALTVP